MELRRIYRPIFAIAAAFAVLSAPAAHASFFGGANGSGWQQQPAQGGSFFGGAPAYQQPQPSYQAGQGGILFGSGNAYNPPAYVPPTYNPPTYNPPPYNPPAYVPPVQQGQSFFGSQQPSQGGVFFGGQPARTPAYLIVTFDRCAAAGYRVTTVANVTQCMLTDGRIFIRPGNSFVGSPRDPSSDLVVVAYGDSLVQGVGASSGNDFVSLLSQRLGIPIVNKGVRGATSADALANLDASVLSLDPDVVILLIGGNDILERVPVQTTAANVSALVTRIQASGASVVLVGVHEPSVTTYDYEAQYRQIAAQTGAYFVPGVLEDIVGRPFLTVDFIHPNDAGYRMIADRIEPTLRQAVRAKAPTLNLTTPQSTGGAFAPAPQQQWGTNPYSAFRI